MALSTLHVLAFALALGATSAGAEQTAPEKAKVVVNDTARAAKKGVHRVEEAVCLKSDAACLARKAKNRSIEASDKAKDKVEEVKDKVDRK